jgi:hypothetical protein
LDVRSDSAVIERGGLDASVFRPIQGSRIPLLFRSFCLQTFRLKENFENVIHESVLTLAKNGDIIVHGWSGGMNQKAIRGTWHLCDDVLQMTIERTFIGKFTEYTVKSHFSGVAQEGASEFLIVGGEISDEMEDPDAEPYVGSFVLVPTVSEL